MTTIHEFLLSRGYRGGDRDPRHENGVLYYRIVGGHTKPCLCNDKLQLCAVVYEFEINGQEHRSVTFEITGEYRGGAWAKLEAYAVSFERAMDECERIENDLLRAWSAMYGAS